MEPKKLEIKPFEKNHNGYLTSIVLMGTDTTEYNKVEIMVRGPGGTLDGIVESLKASIEANREPFKGCHVVLTKEEFCWGG